eukprot:361330-Chlamydomonas_euryale.AAC.4
MHLGLVPLRCGEAVAGVGMLWCGEAVAGVGRLQLVWGCCNWCGEAAAGVGMLWCGEAVAATVPLRLHPVCLRSCARCACLVATSVPLCPVCLWGWRFGQDGLRAAVRHDAC